MSFAEPLPAFIADPDSQAPADGLRSSTSCPVRRIREYLDPALYDPFSPGVSLIGHNVGRDFIKYVLQPVSEVVIPEFEIPWEFGVSHIDAVVQGESAHPGCWEVKSSSKESPSPTTENIGQVQRMIVLAERSGVTLPQPFQIVCVCKTWYRIHGPFPVTLSDVDRRNINAEFDATCELMGRIDECDVSDPAWFAPLACSCSQCFPKPVVEATFAMNLLDEQYAEAKGDKDKIAIRQRMRPLIEAEGSDVVYEADRHLWQITKAGHVRAAVRRRVAA